MEDNWIVVYTGTNLYNAELFKAVLCENNIESVIINKKDSNYLFGEIELWVNNNDFVRAKEILDDPNLSIE